MNEDIIVEYLKTAFSGRFQNEADFDIHVGGKIVEWRSIEEPLLIFSLSNSLRLTNTSSMFQRS